MLARQAAIDAIDTDWILYVSADEIMHSYNAGETLSAAIERADAAGFDVIDFNELFFFRSKWIMCQIEKGPSCCGTTTSLRTRDRANAGAKERLQVSHVEHGGHVLSGEPIVYHRYRLPCATTCFVIKLTL